MRCLRNSTARREIGQWCGMVWHGMSWYNDVRSTARSAVLMLEGGIRLGENLFHMSITFWNSWV